MPDLRFSEDCNGGQGEDFLDLTTASGVIFIAVFQEEICVFHIGDVVLMKLFRCYDLNINLLFGFKD